MSDLMPEIDILANQYNCLSCAFQNQCDLCICKDCFRDCIACQNDGIKPRSKQCCYGMNNAETPEVEDHE